MWTLIAKKKILVFTALVIVVMVALAAGLFYVRSSKPVRADSKCTDYFTGLYDNFGLGPESVDVMANDYSEAIVIATAEDPKALSSSMRVDDPTPYIKVKQVMKNNGDIKVGDVIPICQGLGSIAISNEAHPTVLVFIENKDGDTWVPTSGYLGIAPRNKDGKFTLSGIANKGPTTIP